jgi:hypothetical protein
MDSKFIIAPSWQLESKLAISFHGDSSTTSMCLFGFVLWRTFFSLESSPDATRYAYFAWSDGIKICWKFHAVDSWVRPGVVQISLFVESSEKPLSIVCKKRTTNQQTSCQAFPNTFLIGLQDEARNNDINTRPLFMYSQ